jgi:adenylyltransferase/sulfurtransferase
MLSEDERILFSRQIVLEGFGEKGQVKIKKAKVLVVGMGGLGSFSSLLLTTLGIGYLRIVDRDLIEPTNLHRTPIYTENDLDYAKVEAAAKKLKELNPAMIIDNHACHINETNIENLLEGIDLVIDGLDNFETRRIINRSCVKHEIPFLFCGVSARSGNLTVFNMSKDSPCLSCLYHGINDNDLESCDITGIHPTLLPIVTGIQVYEAVNILLNQSTTLDESLLFIDLHSLNFDKIPIRKNPDCPVCSKSPVLEEISFDGEYKPLELCGGNSVMIVPQTSRTIDIKLMKSRLEDKVKIAKTGSHALTISLQSDQIFVTIFRGGNALIRGITTKKEAMKIWNKIHMEFIK